MAELQAVPPAHSTAGDDQDYFNHEKEKWEEEKVIFRPKDKGFYQPMALTKRMTAAMARNTRTSR